MLTVLGRDVDGERQREIRRAEREILLAVDLDRVAVGGGAREKLLEAAVHVAPLAQPEVVAAVVRNVDGVAELVRDGVLRLGALALRVRGGAHFEQLRHHAHADRGLERLRGDEPLGREGHDRRRVLSDILVDSLR